MPLEHFQELFMHFAVRSEHLLGYEAIRITVKPRHFAARLFQDDIRRRNVPWPYKASTRASKRPAAI